MVRTTEKRRITSLDSLRGLAALSVLITHILGVTRYELLIHLTPFNILKSGHEGVIFFFLLSGYVLVYQYAANPAYTYAKFLVQRFVRIYVPYIVSVVFAIVLFLICKPTHPGTAWIHTLWYTPVSLKIIIKHLVLVGNFNTDAYNPVIWSLVHEVRLALIFPLLLLVVRLKPYKALLIGFMLAALGLISITLNLEPHFGYYNGYSYTAYYLLIFISGGLIATNHLAIMNWYQWLQPGTRNTLLVAALLMYNYANVGTYIFEDAPISLMLKESIFMAAGDFFTTLASAYLIIAAINVSQNHFLAGKVPLFLGKISFSLYLVHMPVIGFLYFMLYGKLPTEVILAMGFVASILTGFLFNRFVERPAMKMAKWAVWKLDTPLPKKL